MAQLQVAREWCVHIFSIKFINSGGQWKPRLCRMLIIIVHRQPYIKLADGGLYIQMAQTHRGNISKNVKKQLATADISSLQQVRLVTVSENDDGQRIDNFLFRTCKGVPKSHIYRILRSGEVRVNKKRIDQTYRLQEGDTIRIPPVKVAEREEKHVPGASFDILYEDDSILVINKPAGVRYMAVRAFPTGSSSNCVLPGPMQNFWNSFTGWTRKPPAFSCWQKNGALWSGYTNRSGRARSTNVIRRSSRGTGKTSDSMSGCLCSNIIRLTVNVGFGSMQVDWPRIPFSTY